MESIATKIASYQDIVFDFIQSQKLFTADQSVLIALSGGRDSMTLLHILSSRMNKVSSAHVNYGLRDEESERDEAFVTSYCEKHSIPLHIKRIEASKWEQYSDNTQAAARSIRYQFFEQLIEETNCQYVATGHHLTDALETMIFQSMRGCGLSGVRGIPTRRGSIVRPLLCLTRQQIDEYRSLAELPYREDRTNEESHYKRNAIRHKIMPAIQEVFPQWDKGYRQTYDHLSESVRLCEQALDDLIEEAVEKRNETYVLDKNFIRKSAAPLSLLWKFLREYGFNSDQCRQILEQDHSGRMFEAGDWQLLEERNRFLLRQGFGEKPHPVRIEQISEESRTEWGTFEIEEVADVSSDSHSIVVDRNALTFPLTIRARKAGDRFQPLGMKGQSKSVKNFMIDEKIPFSEKDHIPILTDKHGTIIWICGYRMDERFKVTEDTEHMLRISWKPDDR